MQLMQVYVQKSIKTTRFSASSPSIVSASELIQPSRLAKFGAAESSTSPGPCCQLWRSHRRRHRGRAAPGIACGNARDGASRYAVGIGACARQHREDDEGRHR